MNNLFNIFISELKGIFKDQGTLIFFILLPIIYPVLYSWIYNNEVVREVPVVVVDQDQSAQSREFIRLYDASPNVNVAFRANSVEEARSYINNQEAYGILYFPSDFSKHLSRMEQGTVGVYCDMSLMLAYKNVYQTATSIQSVMGNDIQTKLLGNKTDREDEISTKPLEFEEVPIFNTTAGYGNFILPGVLILIIQQTLLLGIGMASGTNRERYGRLTPDRPLYRNSSALSIITGKTMALLMVYSVISSYVLLVVPRLFDFVSILYIEDYLCLIIPYLLACIFFSFTAMSLMRQREDVMLIVVFSSIMLLFIAGVSWPTSNIPEVWRYVGCIFPSTFGIKAFIRMNSMGARLEDVKPEILILWLQVVLYLATSLLIYYRDNSKKILNNKENI